MKKIMLIACLALVILGVAFVYTPDVEETDAASCNFTYRVVDSTLTVTNLETPVDGQVYWVYWGDGDPDKLTARSQFSHTYHYSIYAYVKIDVYVDHSMGSTFIASYALNNGNAIQINYQQKITNSVTIYPNGAPNSGVYWYVVDDTANLPTICPYTWEGHTFKYYSLTLDGSYGNYYGGSQYSPVGADRLYCIWEDNSGAVTESSSSPGGDNTVLYCCITISIVVVSISAAFVYIKRH